ncbi:TetR/AcrR family transcriptional regulator [Solimonas marina]|uniref:TetR/AcrR family transcriptional regulator n=1 Tax=Solimonas marina TaxID=2714601 RepID=A0A969WGY0_9GAMM|nr:TetR/AcrR family transcriptional regulator [Solimonas marina]NKF24480.1 TetR/AcrR family transcriptional regulator [Solimonas marina]
MVDAADSKPRRRPRGRPDTREEILRCAEVLLLQRGFNGFSYQHIAVQLGIRTAAVHYYFATKDDLGVALVHRYRDSFQQWVRALPIDLSGWQRLHAYFRTYTEHLDAGDSGRLCPGGAFGADFGVLSDQVRLEARTLMRETYAWLVLTLEEGRRDRSLRFDGDAYDKAVVVGAALQGGLQIARLAGAHRFQQLLAQLELELTGRKPDIGPLP